MKVETLVENLPRSLKALFNSKYQNIVEDALRNNVELDFGIKLEVCRTSR